MRGGIDISLAAPELSFVDGLEEALAGRGYEMRFHSKNNEDRFLLSSYLLCFVCFFSTGGGKRVW
jgi:hypothetical protein